VPEGFMIHIEKELFNNRNINEILKGVEKFEIAL
jgi:hypothetical protein